MCAITIAAIQDSLSIRNNQVFKTASNPGGRIGKLTEDISHF